MNPRTHYPKVQTIHLQEQISAMLKSQPEDLSSLASTSHPKMYFADASNQVTEASLGQVRLSLMDLAHDCGFPHASKPELRRFDQSASEVLYTQLQLLPVEAACLEIWNFLTIVLLPDVAKWRYPNNDAKPNYPRWLGEERNAFRKLWWREHVLGRDFNSKLGEDEAVAIMERPRLGGNPKLARAMAGAFLEVSREYPGIPRSELMRCGALNFRRRMPVVLYDVVPQEALQARVTEIFGEAAAGYARNQGIGLSSENQLPTQIDHSPEPEVENSSINTPLSTTRNESSSTPVTKLANRFVGRLKSMRTP